MRWARGSRIALGVVLSATTSLGPAVAEGADNPNGTFVRLDPGGASTTAQRQSQVSFSGTGVASEGPHVGRLLTYEYDTSLACVDAVRGTDRGNVGCTEATSACTDPTAPGPLRRVWRQDRAADGQIVQPWRVIVVTCAAGTLPQARPAVTLAMVREAFHRTPWATLTTTIQPVGGITLVNLDTYYAASWGESGYGPGEVDALDPASMLGYQVDIRPRLVGYRYAFGDGREFGPTPNPGGPWPTGTIRHQYTTTGAKTVAVTATVGADFRIDGGTWAPIPDTVTLTAASTTLTVKQAPAVLINPDRGAGSRSRSGQ